MKTITWFKSAMLLIILLFAQDIFSITSGIIVLEQDQPGEKVDDYDLSAIVNKNSFPLKFIQTSDFPWAVKDGYAFSTNSGVGNSVSSFETYIDHTDSIMISFQWKAESETCCDKLRFYVNNEEKGAVPIQTEEGVEIGTVDFLTFTIGLPAGSHHLMWEYSKDGSKDVGDDAGFVRDIYVALKGITQSSYIGVNRTNINYGGVNYPSTKTEEIIVSNLGEDVLTITSVDNISSPFRIEQMPNPLNAGESGSLVLSFSPEQDMKGYYSQIVSIQSNGGSRDIVLRGYANQPNGIYVPAYGELHTLVQDIEKDSLIVSGYLNEADFNFMSKTMPHLRYLELVDVTLPNGMIPQGAFEYHTSLKTLVLGLGVRNIGSYAFYYCSSLENIQLSGDLQIIGNYAFCYCGSLKGDLVLPGSLLTIGSNAFTNTSFSSCFSYAINPPSFSEGSGLGNINVIYVPEGAGEAYRNSYVWSEKTIIEGQPLYILVNVNQPGTLGERLLEQVEYLHLINKLTVTGSLNDMDMALMRDAMPSLISVDLSETDLTTIPESQFRDRRNLLDIVFPSTLEVIGHYAFRNCYNLETIDFPDGLKEIQEYAFSSCYQFDRIYLPHSLISLGNEAFRECRNVKEIILSDNLSAIPSGAFIQNEKVTELIIPDNISIINEYAFQGCNALKTIELPSSLESLKYEAFSNCPIEAITLPAGLATIEWAALNSGALKQITCLQPIPPSLDSDPFNNVDKSICELLVPAWSANTYKLANIWNQFTNVRTYNQLVDYLPINGELTLNAGSRPLGMPSVSIFPNSRLNIRDNAPFATNKFWMQHRLDYSYWSGGFSASQFSNLINESSSMTAESVEYSIGAIGRTWFYMAFPFDINMSDITVDADRFYVFREYDGASRATIGTGASWKNVQEGDFLRAGKGYIFQCNDQVNNLILKATDESKNRLFMNTIREVPLSDYLSENKEDQSWNFVGNPFPSYFDISYIDYVAPITIWNGNSYEALSLLDDRYVLRPFEAFFIQKPTDVQSINFLPQGRQTSSSVIQGGRMLAPARNASDRQVLNLVLSNSEFSDKCRVVINPAAALDYEMHCDAAKFLTTEKAVPQLYSLDNNGVNYAINERPQSNGIIPLGVVIGETGNYTLSLNAIDDNSKVILLDKITGIETPLNKEEYTFYAEEGTDNTRFEIRFEQGPTGISSEEVSVKILSSKGMLHLQAPAQASVQILDAAGIKVKQFNTENVHTDITLPGGTYIVVVDGEVYKAIVL